MYVYSVILGYPFAGIKLARPSTYVFILKIYLIMHSFYLLYPVILKVILLL